MAEISAGGGMKLRQMSGQGMMDCKKALEETNGNFDDAMTLLRKKGLATLNKRADRKASEGKIICAEIEPGKKVALASLCCETDFVAKSEDFVAACELLKKYMAGCTAESGADALGGTVVGGKNFSQVITDTVSKTGEKMEIGDYARYSVSGSGFVSSYVHFNNKIGVMVEFETEGAVNSELKSIGTDIAMHIAAINPMALDKSGIDSATIEKERAIAAEQVKGKPANIIDKIVDGKMNKFFAENCLVSQPFVKDDKKTVEQVLNEAAKKAGTKAKIKRFVRFEIG